MDVSSAYCENLCSEFQISILLRTLLCLILLAKYSAQIMNMYGERGSWRQLRLIWKKGDKSPFCMTADVSTFLLILQSLHYGNTPIQIYRKFHLQKLKNFQMKNSDIFHISAQSIDCGYSLEPPRWGGSNEYPQSMVLSRNKKNNVDPCIPQFYYIKVGFKGVKIT